VAKAKQCFAHFHMTPEEYGLWYYCRCVSKISSTVYLSGREIAKEFEGVSKNVIYRIADNLTAKGWFRDLAPYHRNAKTGTLVPRTVYALTHEEWVAQYSDIGCRPPKSPVPKSGQDDPAPVPVTEPPVPKSGHSCPDSRTDLSRNQEQRIKEVETKDERKRVREAKGDTKHPSHPTKTDGQIKAAITALKQDFLAHDPSLKFLPASKDGENPSTLSVIRRRLEQGISPADIRQALVHIPWDGDPNPSFTLRDNLDSAIDRVFQIREQERRRAAMLAESTAREQAAAAAQFAEIERDRAAELDLVEETL